MGYLILENGQYFEGKLFGKKTDSIGELIFNTGMTGYGELISDKTNFGKQVVLTYPLIGNYGITNRDVSRGVGGIKSIIVRELCDFPSNWRAEKTLESYLIDNNISGIQGIDTRYLTKIIVQNGKMKAMITDKLPTADVIKRVKEYETNIPLDKISTKNRYNIIGSKQKIGIIDLGINADFISVLKNRNIDITVLPFTTPASKILNEDFDGVIISDGPNNPNDLTEQVVKTNELIGKVPLFGIGVGHCILALCFGGKVTELKYGHRGGNHPIKCLKTNKMYITSQNHSFIVDNKSISKYAKISFINWNDNTIEGLEYYDKKCMGLQFYPEKTTGPNDTSFLLDKFIDLMEKN